MLLSIFRIARQGFRGTTAGARLAHLLDVEKHPKVHHTYVIVGTVVYVVHIIVSLYSGIHLEGTITAAASAVELISHIVAG